MDEFKIGDVVCLTFDKTKRFLVKSNVMLKGKIQVLYFSETRRKLITADIEPEYLILVPKQD